ncbi:MAG: hypothetical protein ABIH92_03000 [Nanoarchaeota archaeon]
MVNKDIVNWLLEAKKRGFTVQLLKKKLLEAGFPERDVDEAIFAVENKPNTPIVPEKIDLFARPQPAATQTQPVQQPTQTASVSSPMTSKPQGQEFKGAELLETKPLSSKEVQMNKAGYGRAKWMKIAGIIGIFLLLFALASIVLNFVAKDSLYSLTASSTVSLIVLFVTLLLVFFYYFGFVKMGKKTGERLLSLGSWFILVPMILYLVLFIVVGVVLLPQYTTFAIGEGSESFKIIFLIISIIWVVLFLLNVIGQLLFSVGLMKAGKQIKFAKATGVLNIIVFVAGLAFIVGAVILVYSVLNVFSTGLAGGLDIFTELSAKAMFAVYSFASMYVLWIIATLFGILALFNGSKKFEN